MSTDFTVQQVPKPPHEIPSLPQNNPLIPPALARQLTTLYTNPNRPPHTLDHLRTLLAQLTEHAPLVHDVPALEAAIWIHDAIHNPRAPNTEALSAQIASRYLVNFADRARVARVMEIVIATATHTLPQFPAKKHLRDAELFLDIDLCVMGAEREDYVRYEEAVREEYAWVDEETWVKGRGGVLRGFLERPHIFHTKMMREKFEETARGNLAWSLKKMEKEEEERIKKDKEDKKKKGKEGEKKTE